MPTTTAAPTAPTLAEQVKQLGREIHALQEKPAWLIGRGDVLRLAWTAYGLLHAMAERISELEGGSTNGTSPAVPADRRL